MICRYRYEVIFLISSSNFLIHFYYLKSLKLNKFYFTILYTFFCFRFIYLFFFKGKNILTHILGEIIF